jgi:outer membrane lipoprotein-sorting protein
MLPVRMEFEYWQGDGTTKSLRVFDRFQWNPKLPDDTFTPRIPEGFTLVDADEH